jgi:hypothetical protein
MTRRNWVLEGVYGYYGRNFSMMNSGYGVSILKASMIYGLLLAFTQYHCGKETCKESNLSRSACEYEAPTTTLGSYALGEVCLTFAGRLRQKAVEGLLHAN